VQTSDLPLRICGTPTSPSALPHRNGRSTLTEPLLAKPILSPNIIDINKTDINIRAPLIRLQNPHSIRRRNRCRLASYQDQNTLVADWDMDHCAVHPGPNIRRDRDIRESRWRVLDIRIKLQHALQNCSKVSPTSTSPPPKSMQQLTLEFRGSSIINIISIRPPLHIPLKDKTLIQNRRIARVRRSRTLDLVFCVNEVKSRFCPSFGVGSEFQDGGLRDIGDVAGFCKAVE
jgi:hypothetical protein